MEAYLDSEEQTIDEFEADLEKRVRDAVAAQIGRGLDDVVAAAQGAGAPPAPAAEEVPAGAVTRTVTLVNDIGLTAFYAYRYRFLHAVAERRMKRRAAFQAES